MNDLVLMYTITLTFIAVFAALLLVYRYFLGNRLLRQADKLRNEINRIPKDYAKILREPSDIVGSAIGDMGIGGILKEFDIDPDILKNPIIRGLIDRYAPRVLEQLNKQKGGGCSEQRQNGFM